MKLSQRVYECECGLVMDRDENAAINIKTAERVERGVSNQLIGEAKASQNKGILKRESKKLNVACLEQA